MEKTLTLQVPRVVLGCGAAIAWESPMELHLTHRTFDNDTTTRIFICFAGTDGTDERQSSHPVKGEEGHDKGC
jgi:hypothetical protein